jgi:glycosyltransferase involved in cell wall biosynthesis
VFRFFNIINTPVPFVHVAHSTAAAFCGIPCVISKMQNKTTYLLTEHGVYLREQYLSLSQREYTSFMNTFLIRMVQSVVSLNYYYADQVSPVCEYNTKWEEKLGVDNEKIKVIYNGVEKSVFLSDDDEIKKEQVPTVVLAARVDPIKDIISAIKTAELVKKEIDNVKFVVYGSVSVPIYKKECDELIDRLKLKDTFKFAGHTDNVAAAYKSADVVLLSSISEAFPYSVIEAMLSGKPVVATDVGGVSEALGETGFLVNPRDYLQMTESIVKLLRSSSLRAQLGGEARQRALNLFTVGNFLQNYMKTYISLSMGVDAGTYNAEDKIDAKGKIAISQQYQLLYLKGYTLMKIGQYEEAIEQFKLALNENPQELSVPIVLLTIAEAYEKLGDYDKAEFEIRKANIMTSILNKNTA